MISFVLNVTRAVPTPLVFYQQIPSPPKSDAKSLLEWASDFVADLLLRVAGSNSPY